MLKITHEHYLRIREINGVRDIDGEKVTAEFVRKFLGAKDWFQNSFPDTPPEKHTKTKAGAILVEATSPDGEVHVNVFTPVQILVDLRSKA